MYLFSASTALKIHDVVDYSLKYSYECYENPIGHVEWSSTGKYMIQVNPSGRLEILSVTVDGVRSVQYLPSSESLTGAFQSGDHREIGVGTATGKVFIWNAKSKSVVKTFPAAESPVRSVCFNAVNGYLAAALESGVANVYGVNTNSRFTAVKIPFSNSISVLAFHNAERSTLGLASNEGSILLRDLAMDKRRMFVREAHASVVSGMVFSPVNEKVLFSCGFDKRLRMHDTRMQTSQADIRTEYALTSVDTKDGRIVAVGNRIGEVSVYDLRHYSSPFAKFRDHDSAVNRVGFQPEMSKNRKYVAADMDAIESSLPKLSSPKCPIESPDRSFPPMEFPPSPIEDPASSREVDSFLVNVLGEGNGVSIDGTSDSRFGETPKDLRSDRFLNVSKRVGDGDAFDSPLCFTSFSTPVIKNNNFEASDENGVVVDGAFVRNVSNSSSKKLNNDSVSVIETIKNTNDRVSEENFREILKYGMFDVMNGCRRNYINMTMEHVKSRICFEDQLAAMMRKIEDLSRNQNVLIDQNKKLMIELEILRSQQTKPN